MHYLPLCIFLFSKPNVEAAPSVSSHGWGTTGYREASLLAYSVDASRALRPSYFSVWRCV
ncbi:hypothetical protein N7501_001437 [Penicillium viridicatum]|nr:hypothetical protein N7501_001437 [Penicillium viridicatum]